MVATRETSVVADIGDEAAVAHDARSRILKAAEMLFRERGFAGTSMDAIAALARISKRTLYAEFADKRAILEGVLDRFIAGRIQIVASLSRRSDDDRETLIAIARGLLDATVAEDTSAMLRLLVGEINHLPALAKRVNQYGLTQSLELMRGPLERLGVADPVMAGRLIYDLAALAPGHRALLGASEVDVPVEQIVDIILSGVPRQGGGRP